MIRVSGRFALPVALLLPPLAWMSFQYGLGAVLRPACAAVGWIGPIWGGAALAACIVAFSAARRAIGDRSGREGATGRWMAAVACLGAGVFALAILFQTLATLIVPPCVR
ncbi:hypothetical protein [Aureimonas sp. AU4]|uniref:hypothetical protein n=1 Tax=Aureimonas sp. AU4 TaxID=1638163 RepID=UPI000782D229|nr:hypothetical protein [Aureimonas sp. AU4]